MSDASSGSTRDQSWRDDAACRDADPDAWFPEVGGISTHARRVCYRCPVRAQCLAYAEQSEAGLPIDERAGYWGGLSRVARWRRDRAAQRTHRQNLADIAAGRRSMPFQPTTPTREETA